MNRKDNIFYFLYIFIVILQFVLSFYFLITSKSIKDLFNTILKDNQLLVSALFWLNGMVFLIGLVRMLLINIQQKPNRKDKDINT